MIRCARAATAKSFGSLPLYFLILLLGIAGPSDSIGDETLQTQRTRLFVLGTPHLSSLKDEFRPELLDGLIDRLRGLQPDAILVEALPGPSIVSMELQGGSLDEVLEQYSRRMTIPGRRAQETLDLSWAEAYRKIDDLDRGCDKGITREKCILIYLAAYEYDTALLTFSTTPEPEREAFRERYADIAESFDKSLQSSNEYYTIANRLAQALGRARIHPVDAHREKGPLLDAMTADPSIEAFFERVFGNYSEHPYVVDMKARERDAVEKGDLLPYYRWLNDPVTLQGDFDFQWAPLLGKDDESHFGKTRLALWEQRNLLMAANIARVLAEYPGKTAIYIVGSGHKRFMDAYFNTTNWVEVLSVDQVLGIADANGQ
jgi:hypothetical protein